MLEELASHIHLHTPSSESASTKPASRTYIIYYITGNPGLIEYYRTFLTHLYGLLQSSYSDEDVEFEIYGRSLNGFETSKRDIQGRRAREGKVPHAPPFNVNEQIQLSENDLKRIVEDSRRRGKKDVRVILMGHSLGTYICMEVMQRLRGEALVMEGDEDSTRVVGGVLLFATVMNLAGSPSGQKSRWLISLPYFPLFVSLIAKALFLLIPVSIMTSIISTVMKFPADAARVTASFLKSPHGVRQAIYMAHDEMSEISIDKWDDEIWGAAHPSAHPHPRPTLRFLFAKEDHWVATSTRDALIAARGAKPSTSALFPDSSAEPWKPLMEVDETQNWPHGFCIRHSIPVAERVRGYIDDIVAQDL